MGEHCQSLAVLDRAGPPGSARGGLYGQGASGAERALTQGRAEAELVTPDPTGTCAGLSPAALTLPDLAAPTRCPTRCPTRAAQSKSVARCPVRTKMTVSSSTKGKCTERCGLRSQVPVG